MEKTCKSLLHITLCALLPTLLFAQVERWVYDYDGVGNAEDEAYVVTYGADGNIYAAGYSTGNGTGFDFTVVSLSSTGSERWVYTYNGPVSLTDVAYDIVYGFDGNIYTVGASTGSNDLDITIVSLTSNGTERWIYTYNGPSNQDDEAFAIAYGLNNNVYAAGKSRGVATEDDFTIISVDTAGSEQWVYRYDRDNYFDGANSIVYGNDNNVYAAGYTYHWIPTQEFTVLSVDTTGTYRWYEIVPGGGTNNETALGLAWGFDSNLYIVGRSMVRSYTVTSIDTTGTWRWRHYYGQIGNNNAAPGVVQGQDLNVYTTGHLQISTHYDFTVAAHNAAGDSLWMMTYDGPTHGHDVGYSVDYGDNGRVYAVGYSNGFGSGEDFVVLDVDTTGCLHWVYRYNGSSGSSDIAHSVVYGQDKNIYAAGYCTNMTSNTDFLVISLDTTTTGLVEEKYQQIPGSDPSFPTYISGTIQLPEENMTYKIFDITGRQIHTLNPAPGIYFIEVDGEIRQKMVKVR